MFVWLAFILHLQPETLCVCDCNWTLQPVPHTQNFIPSATKVIFSSGKKHNLLNHNLRKSFSIRSSHRSHFDYSAIVCCVAMPLAVRHPHSKRMTWDLYRQYLIVRCAHEGKSGTDKLTHVDSEELKKKSL